MLKDEASRGLGRGAIYMKNAEAKPAGLFLFWILGF